nr:hypothetical protein CFP56_40763 [Quercus suber]
MLILPRDIGGPGLYASGTRNLPLLAKLNRRILTEADSLWACVLKPNSFTPVTPLHPVSSNPHFAGGGGSLLCNSNGDWIRGVSHSIGSTSILLAELWALRDGLIMARSLGIQKIIVNVDASDINSLVFSSNSVNRLTQPPVADC